MGKKFSTSGSGGSRSKVDPIDLVGTPGYDRYNAMKPNRAPLSPPRSQTGKEYLKYMKEQVIAGRKTARKTKAASKKYNVSRRVGGVSRSSGMY